MSFELKANAKTNQIDLVLNGEVIKTLSENESIDFYDSLKGFINDHDYLYNPLWQKIGIEEIELDIAPMEKVKGLSFEMMWYYEDAHFCKDSNLGIMLFDDPTRIKMLENEDIYDNFPKEKFLSGKFTNHELRACLQDDLITYIKEKPEFKLYFNYKEMNKEDFLNEETTVYYKTGVHYDFERPKW